VLHDLHTVIARSLRLSAILCGEGAMTVKLLAAVDRRHPNRVSPPVCPRCGTDDAVTVMKRTDAFVYFQCAGCWELLPMRVPVIAHGKALVDHVTD
jgi:hypothetical protein